MLAGPKAAVCRLAAIAVSSALCAMLAGPLTASAYPAPAVAAAPDSACGSVEIGSAQSKDVLADENCFSKAWSTCDAAMFSVAYHGSDAAVTRTFETMRSANSDQCEVAEVVDRYKGSTLASSDTYLCNDIKQASDGLNFYNCGAEGTVWVPTNLTAQNAGRLMTVAFVHNMT